MRKILYLFFVAVLFMHCSSNKLTREKAAEIIKNNYPELVDWDIFCGDPEFAKKVLDTDLEKDGYVTIKRTHTFNELSEPWINFAEKAKPYFLTTPPGDKEHQIQKVKVADIQFGEITGMKMLANDKKAIVEYKIEYKNLTPFAILAKIDDKKPVTRTAYFSLYDDGWRQEKKPDIDFLVP
jgi:hypothetical protein